MTYTKEQVLAIIGEDEPIKNLYKDYKDILLMRKANRLRAEQRKRLENMKPKKVREVIKYC